jgi:nucleoside-diphosphate-sugar epimerase
MKILVTGSEGNIGSKLVPYLRSKGHYVYRCDIKQGVGPYYSVADINNPLDLCLAFSRFKPTVVFHLAAMVSRVTCEKSKALTIQTNLSGTENVIQLCKECGAKLIHFSTSEVYGNIGGVLSESREDLSPNNIYGASKLMSENLVKYEVKDGLNAMIVRPFMFYDENETLGEHRSAMIRFAEKLLKRQTITVHRGAERSWMHINDGVRVLEALLNVPGFHVVNIGSSEVYKMEDLARGMCNYLELKYADYVEEINLPDHMTLTKTPDVRLQEELTGLKAEIGIDEGIKRVFDNVMKRI